MKINKLPWSDAINMLAWVYITFLLLMQLSCFLGQCFITFSSIDLGYMALFLLFFSIVFIIFRSVSK
jgi:hypothetical protein